MTNNMLSYEYSMYKMFKMISRLVLVLTLLLAGTIFFISWKASLIIALIAVATWFVLYRISKKYLDSYECRVKQIFAPFYEHEFNQISREMLGEDDA